MRHNISPRFTKVEIEVKTGIDKTVISLEIDHTVEIEINHIEAEEIIIETIDQIIEVDHKITIEMMIGETNIDMMIGRIATDKMIDVTIIGKKIEETITDPIIGQIMEETIIGNKDIEPEVKVGKILEIIIEIIHRFEQGRDISRDRSRKRQSQPRSRMVLEDRGDRPRSESRS